jgi:hypothetical protein
MTDRRSRSKCFVHQTLKMTPAMVAGVTSRLWEMGDIVNVLEAREQKREAGHIAA